jgi:hypothetical protein
MKIQIDRKGRLHIERGGTMKPQGCPFCHNDSSCGDWCPQFHTYALSIEHNMCIKLCGGSKLYCPIPDFLDERTATTQES